jgi:beta-N-acetylhexosaminidase
MKREHAIPQAIAAGADMLLFVRDMDTDFDYMMNGYKNGVISESRLNEAVTRILAFKASLKLHEKAQKGTLVPAAAALKEIGTKENADAAARCADAGVTLIKDTQRLLPINPAKHKRIYLNVLEDSDNPHTELRKKLKAKLEAKGFSVSVRDRSSIANLSMLASAEKIPLYRRAAILLNALKSLDELVGSPKDFLQKYDLVIYVANFETDTENSVIRLNWKGFKGIGNDIPWFVHEIPTLFISLSNPYHLLDVPMIKTYINAYTNSDFVIDAVIEKLLGNSNFVGISPVDVSCGRDDVMY